MDGINCPSCQGERLLRPSAWGTLVTCAGCGLVINESERRPPGRTTPDKDWEMIIGRRRCRLELPTCELRSIEIT
jgi:rubredoxin